MIERVFHHHSLILEGLSVYAVLALRYLVIAGGAFLFFYVLFPVRLRRFRIQQKLPPKKKIRMEIHYSLLTFAVFSWVGLVVAWMGRNGWTRVYLHLHDYPLWWFWLSIPCMLILHDTWFYWSHRFMHLKAIFPIVHRVHHLSTNPTPWAAFSFHPIEALIEAAILPLIVVLVPVHPLAILCFLLAMTVMNVIGHLGHEVFPSGFTRRTLTRWGNTSTHHNLHHRFVKCNYSLYLNFWDRVMGTNHMRYSDEFEKVVRRRKQIVEAAKRYGREPEVVVTGQQGRSGSAV